MKSFLLSLALLALVITGVCVNRIYISHAADVINGTVSQLDLKDDSKESLEKLERYWEKHQKYIGLSVSYRELDHLGEMLISLRWAYDTENEAEFEKYRALTFDAVEEITRMERFSIENLF